MGTLALVGGQYGSEGKGVIAAALAQGATLAVRTGGPNAGHSINHERRIWKMRSIPCAWVNPTCTLVIGPGAIIDPEVLIREADELEAAGYKIRERLLIDPAATVIIPVDRIAEEHTIVGPIGSTGEGVGAARIRKMARFYPDMPTTIKALPGFRVEPTIAATNYHAIAGHVLLEGTQGYGLSLHHGQWPYVTSANTTAAQLASDAGLGIIGNSGWGVLVVFRSFPIRVGGHSGPMRNEVDWQFISDRMGRPIEERTTVTNKVRRVARFDWDLSKEAVMVNGATCQALTFADYIDPKVEGVTRFRDLTRPVRAFMEKLENAHGIPIVYVGTGGPTWSVINLTTDPDVRGGDTSQRKDHTIASLS